MAMKKNYWKSYIAAALLTVSVSSFSAVEKSFESAAVTSAEVDGQIVFTMPTRNAAFGKTIYHVDPAQTVRISGEFRLKNGGSNNTKIYFGFQEFDKNNQHITPVRCNTVGGSLVRLTEKAEKGSKTITVNNPALWKKFGKNDYVVFNAYSDHRDLPNTTRPIKVVSVEDNGVVTLASELDQSYEAESGVRLHRDRAPNNNIGAEGKMLSGEWQSFSGEVRNMQAHGTRDKMWRPGTRSVRVVISAMAPARSQDIVEFRNIKVETAGDELIKSGAANLQLASFNRKLWKQIGNTFCGEGMNNKVSSYHVYEPEAFEVEAELELAKFEGTAAAICAGNINWGLDGGSEHRLFVEGRDFKIRFLDKAADHITLNKPFKILLKGNRGVMTLAINGKVIGECKYPLSRPMYFGLRPHRNSMKIHNMTIRAVRNGEGSDALPVVTNFVDISEDTKITLPGFPAPSGVYNGILQTLDGKSSSAVTLHVDDNAVARINAAELKKAYVQDKSKYNLRPFMLKVTPKGYSEYRTRVVLADKSAAIDFPQGEIRQHNGRSIACIDGEPRDMMQALWSYNGRATGEKAYTRDSVARFAKHGIKGNMLILAPYAYLGKDSFDLKGFMADTELAITKIIAENPDSLIDIQFFLFTSEEFNAAHQDELIKLDNGKTTLAHAFKKMLMPSYASPAWRKMMREVIIQCVKAMRKSPYADRMASFRVLYANCGEWNHWGYHEQAFVDFSAPMQKAFGQWLKNKYGTVEKLRAAWQRNDVDFDSKDLIPTREQRLVGKSSFRLGDQASVVPSADYYKFFSECAVDTILHFTGAVKEASDNRLLAGSYYGYYFGHYYANPYHFLDSGNYALNKLVRSKDIDFCGAPNPYYHRINVFWCNHIAGTFALHNKLFVREGDMRTEFSDVKPHPHYGVPENKEETLEIMKRDFAGSIERGIDFYFYDFIADWYRNPDLAALIGKLNLLDRALKDCKLDVRPAEVAIIYSEETTPYLTSAQGDRVLRDFSGEELNRMGIPVDLYLIEDLEKIDFSRYKAVIFANSFYISDKTMADIKKYAAGGNRTLIYLSAPGMIGNNGKITPERALELTGIAIEMLDEPRKGNDIKTIWKKTIPQRPFAQQCRFADNVQGKVLANFADDNSPAAVERKFSNYKNITVLHPFPDAIFWRDLLAANKVHVYTSGRTGLDNFYMAWPLMAYTSRKGGAKQISLKKPVEIAADILTGEVLARNSNIVKFNVPDDKLHTRLLYAGKEEEFKKLRAAIEVQDGKKE